jgi:hypothetical protein
MRRCLSLTLALLALTAVVIESSVAASDAPMTYGTSATLGHTLHAYSFSGAEAFDYTIMDYSGDSRLCNGSGCFLYAGAMLPAGARVTGVELDACDDNAAGSVSLDLVSYARHEASFVSLVTGLTTGETATPGCTTVTGSLATPHTIDNAGRNYYVRIEITGGTITTRFQAVRILYTLQVSPAPATATFGDVPTSHPFFQFVEALVNSGITAGCGGGNYCPDAPLTRGQMAVFLSKALGLHFAP